MKGIRFAMGHYYRANACAERWSGRYNALSPGFFLHDQLID